MIIDEAVYLEHYGVKGMRWGFRRNPAKRLERMSADSAITGYGLRGYAAQKVYKRYTKKHGDIEGKKFDKLPESVKRKYDTAVKRRAYSAVIGRGVVEAALVGGAGTLAIKKLNLDSKTKDQVKTGALAFAGISSVSRAVQVKAIRDSYKMDKLRKEVHGN